MMLAKAAISVLSSLLIALRKHKLLACLPQADVAPEPADLFRRGIGEVEALGAAFASSGLPQLAYDRATFEFLPLMTPHRSVRTPTE